MTPEEPLTAVGRPNVPAGTARTPLGTAPRRLPGRPTLPRRRRRCKRSETRRGKGSPGLVLPLRRPSGGSWPVFEERRRRLATIANRSSSGR
jgi:hypothetical protein